ncbi:MAG TPA: PHP domain-containing protein [Deltaproteobacteria bacterium]|nr:MAG: PHP domain-containing protein [Deltaproteobacteria bacterium GWA2_55_82]OGQ62506.1 MAG: PHP domain-containing protein [Deltaproteobacteria bacterium RIFCSPLOWO2_02_FULL_55_12]OIJ73033.1 MAG: PHP domain-containing protein [Deltaproteobacteria bacterium GWC2_55_46]HBG45957.1 PHP domain-containing protein [Deltaproteobacteria bacterium]HCY11824.1 PHP domain-containing protein [Deltaproteobacteria bacterium]
MIDFHMHSFLSDGVLVPTELVRRARVAGYTAMAITDHVDASNIENVLRQITKVASQLTDRSFTLLPGVELTHIPPKHIPLMVKKARALGAQIVIGHGETLSEPVEPGTNIAYIKAGVDILAHPGLITEEECRAAVKKSVCLEITSRAGHSISNGHVAAVAKRAGAKMLVNTDSHAPGDLISDEMARKVALGAGLNIEDFRRIQENAKELVRKKLG